MATDVCVCVPSWPPRISSIGIGLRYKLLWRPKRLLHRSQHVLRARGEAGAKHRRAKKTGSHPETRRQEQGCSEPGRKKDTEVESAEDRFGRLTNIEPEDTERPVRGGPRANAFATMFSRFEVEGEVVEALHKAEEQLCGKLYCIDYAGVIKALSAKQRGGIVVKLLLDAGQMKVNAREPEVPPRRGDQKCAGCRAACQDAHDLREGIVRGPGEADAQRVRA